MRYTTPICPECGERADGTLEIVPGRALLQWDEAGSAEYAGETKMFWDDQKDANEEDERATMLCPNGHDWLSEVRL